MKKYLLLFLLLPTLSYGRDLFFNISTSFLYTNINEPDYQYINEYEEITKINSINLGASYKINNYILNLSTNRVWNPEIEREIKYLPTNTIYLNKSKIYADSLQIGRLFNEINISLMLINLKLEKSLYYNNIIIGKKINHSILKGLNISYFLDKSLSLSFYYIFPEKEIYLENAVGLSINFHF